ncbi:MAG: DUF4258 domain-containing protein [Burkholderiales bacterium]|nr:DUF4258 domain-containing protein [Burkholderiales bacterium]
MSFASMPSSACSSAVWVSMDVAAALRGGRIIEDYPTDFPYGSALWLGLAGGKPLHVVAADNVAADERIIVTVYEPDPALWEPDWATRKKP